jgi:hypothetical protein
MDRHYQVKFTWGKTTHFGVVDSFSDEAKKLPQGMLLVEDAVTPQRYKVVEADVVDVPMRFPDDEYHKYVDAEFAKAQAISDALPEGVHVGSLFSIGVADGSAWYVVTKVNKKTCKVEWRGFCMDRWTDHFFGYGRTVNIADVSRYTRFARGMKRLFAKKV